MERLLHYVWKHKIFPLHELRTTDGRLLEVISPGMGNTDAGPDFKEAKIKIDGIEWVGNVEIHLRTSDWFRHGHDTDPTYANVLLHVASVVDRPLYYPDGREIPQLCLQVPSWVADNYDALSHNDSEPPCRDILGTFSPFFIHNWMTSLALERFEERARQITARRETLDKDWEATLFVTLARNFGFGINGDAFEHWAMSVPLGAVGKHRDNLFQIEALFFGQAGLLNGDCHDDYHRRLQNEYHYLSHKFSLSPIDASEWKYLRLRPQNFPHIRIAQLAILYYEQRLNLSRLVEASTLAEINALLCTRVSDYWRTHYTFGGQPSHPADKMLSPSSVALLVINSVAPILFAYGRYKSMSTLCDHAFSLWEQIAAENNRIVRNWAQTGIHCENAADSQALIQLHQRYCRTRDCLRCRFGHEYIRRTPDFLRECEEKSTSNN